jgi:hypothetical protein
MTSSVFVALFEVKFIGHSLNMYCFIKHVIGGKIQGMINVTATRGRKG